MFNLLIHKFIKFSFLRNFFLFILFQSNKKLLFLFQIDLLTYESILTIRKVRPADYGSYECVSRNEMGFATVSIKLEVTSSPDPPVALTVLNVTHDSIKVTWKPGFNGGLQQNFRLRYRKTNTDG
jgi:hypothetical protein